jgi:hypothetical protein
VGRNGRHATSVHEAVLDQGSHHLPDRSRVNIGCCWQIDVRQKTPPSSVECRLPLLELLADHLTQRLPLALGIWRSSVEQQLVDNTGEPFDLGESGLGLCPHLYVVRPGGQLLQT